MSAILIKVTLLVRAEGREGYDSRQQFADQVARSVSTHASDIEWMQIVDSQGAPARHDYLPVRK